jgi:hypothetical protein
VPHLKKNSKKLINILHSKIKIIIIITIIIIYPVIIGYIKTLKPITGTGHPNYWFFLTGFSVPVLIFWLFFENP